ncbi:hypothetical protein VOLCADRAFT_46347, partial [Volvox carteri f. nagariensis]
ALLCIDVQCDFMPGGSLAVPRGDEVIPVINKLRRICRDQLSLVALTQDYHPEDHRRHRYQGGPRLWPTHCVAGSPGADLVLELVALPHDVIVRKGTRRDVDGYSAFFDNGRWLRSAGVSRLLVAGLATEYCVLWTVRDAVKLGYQVWVVADAVRGMGGPEEISALAEM